MNKKYLIIIFVIIIFTLSFARSFLGLLGIIPWQYGYSDVYNADRIASFSAEKIPYINTSIEYPILTGFFIYLNWYFGKSLEGYIFLTYIFLTIFAVITALILFKTIKLLKMEEKNIWRFFVFGPSLLVFGVYNWDIMAVMFAVTAFYFFLKEKYGLAALALALGFNAKIFPIIFLPIMMFKVDLKKALKMLVVFTIICIVINSYFMFHDFNSCVLL